ncbi:hypothetical protein Pflav_056100 [Phytohabitans flavus]|uniref:ThuA-like domain-containing protein n=1 Tax=Phytohabitans flavus TaxID=1076124 RepID=A0A6F8XZG3_9ACTN|nr:ThuA domain-containing protein [Phytohabitans flavus]BCB79200.1 hypothetical protein Pflav_056100 [Phytohabitans flavus]
MAIHSRRYRAVHPAGCRRTGHRRPRAWHQREPDRTGEWPRDPPLCRPRPESYKVLVFTKTDGARRASIQDGVRVIRALGEDNGFTVTVTQDGGAFTAVNLAEYRAVVFLNTTGNVLNPAQEAAFEAYFRAGGGYVGVHAAAETEQDWTFYRNVLGTGVSGVSGVDGATVKVADRAHPSTETVPRELSLNEEWYNYTSNVRGASHVLATVDEKSYAGGTMGFDHPVAWCKDYQGGRSWYTGLGHSIESYRNGSFKKHLLGGIQWSAGVVEGDCGATVLANYEKVTLNDEPGEPMSLSVLPDGRVLHNTRGGEIRLYDPETGASPVITNVPVYTHDEDGLQTLTIDPDFANNKWVYVYYAPRLNTPVDDPATPGVNEGDAPATSNDPTVWDKFKGTTSCPGSSSWKSRRRTSTSPASSRSSAWTPTAASVATSPAR